MGNSKLRRNCLTTTLGIVSCIFLLGCDKPVEKTVESSLPTDAQLCDRLDRVHDFTYTKRHLNTKDQAAWQIVHGALVYGRDFQIYHDGKLVGALDYLLSGGELRGWTMRKGDHGVTAVLEAGSKTGQGHPDQWLGYLSQCGLSPDGPLVVAGQNYKIQDLITQAQWDIYDGMEATWTLMALSTYLPLDAEWSAKDGSTWNIPRIVRMETAQDLNASACGGTHRMYGLTTAVNRYLAEGGKLADKNDSAGSDDTWEKAHKKIRDAVAACKEYQQPDGSLSTNYFSRPGTSADIAARISTTGHALEFLMIALDDDELKEPWVTRAALHLVGCFEKTQSFDLECGALYHAAHGLDLYRARRFGPRTSSPSSEPPKPAADAAAAAGK